MSGVSAGFARRNIESYSGTISSSSFYASPADLDECRELLEAARAEGFKICPRGNGNSYADQILCRDQALLSTSKMRRIISWDSETGVLRVEPGATYEQMLAATLQDNWTLGAIVGIPAVTAAGALANNVHGKSSWKWGNFGESVISFKLLKADGTLIEVGRESDPELFRSAIGGMGLFGIVVELALQCRKIPSPYVECRTRQCANLEELIAMMESGRGDSDFLIAWVDAFARGPQLGRGFVKAAKWVDGPKPPSGAIESGLKPASRVFGLFPQSLTWGALRWVYGASFVKSANIIRYRMNSGKNTSVSLFPDFNFLHNRIPGINRVYRPHGFMELQPLIPKSAGVKGIRRLLQLCQERGYESLLCGLKIHRADDFALSFEGDGYSFGVDFAMKGRRREDVEAFSRDFFSLVADLGGKVYLAKDELLSPDIFRRMYPGYESFSKAKNKADPDGVFSSDMYRRLFEVT